ncbi:Putative protein of unknown function [Podospora comata]|uniref:EDC4-like protein pdc1 beta-propeller domain-containing protein n=1 Tax=Podospora comata TaxID=48703 RepID=A0ABY6SFF6_PODCO|nr:Putative protein of unknown function [Podospora comata]
MSNYGLPGGGNGAPDTDASNNFESLLAQLRRQSSPSPGPSSGPGPEHFSQFGTYSQGAAGQSFYGHHSNTDSPNLPGGHASIDSPAFLPEAPTPPVGFGGSQFPPGLMNPIGAGRHVGGGGAGGGGDERTAHLLNLLKFNSSGSQGGPQSMQQPAAAAREPPINYAPAHVAPQVIHAPAPAAADPTGLLAALMKGRLDAESTKPEAGSTSSSWNQSAPPAAGTQQYLLNLLNRPKPSQHDADTQEPSLLTPPPAEDESSHGGRSAEPTLVGTLASRSEFEFDHKNVESPHSLHSHQSHQSHPSHQTGHQSGTAGNYSNPFDDLSSSSPVHRTPKSSTTPGASSTAGTSHPVPTSSAPAPASAAGPIPGTIQILKKPEQGLPRHQRPFNDRGLANSPESARRQLEYAPSPLSHTSAAEKSDHVDVASVANSASAARLSEVKESVSDAVNGLAEQVDREAREAVARAQQEQAQAGTAQDFDHLLNDTTEEEFAHSTQSGPRSQNQEFAHDDGRGAIESTLTSELAKDLSDNVEDGSHSAQQPVADSWESAEADEIVVIEETAAPVKVYNFPMKPWITINLQETDEPRPVFREEAILDIARLKKDFDQIDRNLVSASETYMAYGMSKAGGLRVIRQEDGKDAKLFTDTKDRIFNVAISTSPSTEHPKEAIIGTGVSGTVYWVQLKNGERDHLEDAHPEQYGFALPPISSQEGGDIPGGVLKTRARTSSMHPDFFAVGRGKSINIIWPSFIFENNLFKNAHDRVVDTEKLLKQCSLKINTGKAGKDFTFSQDDTVVVSLDKSGRVKFWDVRDLTAVKEGSERSNPVPAQTTLEIKEPLLTLTTTPEGEKAWPTSVLLLDKYRPYQKRVALRYMVVGMKQNHTLQLWDLALGKPVQEFNFPHNKESDAVCSVMYHAPSSMIVVGHPTRNSIYFLHLSAPKYTLKNLSQVDYIQRLVAQDSSIPQPESTAVISGIREYSFANKGVLRSLTMLENPAATADGDEPTLFELYAMHSKGVTCLFVKQAELGWTKDNKVILLADAVETGLVTISKLVAPPPLQPAEASAQSSNILNDAATASQIRIVSRNAKEALQKMPSSQGEEKKGAGVSTPPKFERKEENDTPAPQPERNEKKGRKKKAAQQAQAQAAAAAAAATGATDRDYPAPNGAAELNRATLQKLGKASRGNNGDQSSLPPSIPPAEPSSTAAAISSEHLEAVVNKMESRIVANISSRFDTVFSDILKQMQEIQKRRDAEFANSQSHLLQMVSDVLNDNTESVLRALIIEQIDKNVIPSICSSVDRSVAEQLSSQTSSQVNAVQQELKRALPISVNQALQQTDLIKTISDKVSYNVNARIDQQVEIQITKAFNTLAPQLAKNTAQSLHQRIVEDVHGHIHEAFERLEKRRRDEDAKLDRLIAQTKELSTAVASLAAVQSQISKDFGTLREQVHQSSQQSTPIKQELNSRGHRDSSDFFSQTASDYGSQHFQHTQHQHQLPVSHARTHPQAPQPVTQRPQQPHQQALQHQFNSPSQQLYSPSGRDEEREAAELNKLLETIHNLLQNDNIDAAMLKWLHSGDKAEVVFQHIISRQSPGMLRNLAPLLLLSIGANLVNEFHSNTPKLTQKIDLLEFLLAAFESKLGSMDEQTREVTPRIMSLMRSKFQSLQSELMAVSPQSPQLNTLASMVKIASQIVELMKHGAVAGPVPSHIQGHYNNSAY